MSAQPAPSRRPDVAAIGGGHGLARALAALRADGHRPTAVVAVADDGGSTGMLRAERDIIAPGDLRRALLALSTRPGMADVLAHRFAGGGLDGHVLGNLLLLALAQRHDGDWVAALREAGDLLGCEGEVLPATTRSVALGAVVDGVEVVGQAAVARTGPVQRVWLDPPDAVGCEAAVEALGSAGLVVIGPGSLFTSLLAALLPAGLVDAIGAGDATVVVVLNLATQPGETSGMDAGDHLAALADHAPGLRVDAVVAHDGPPPATDGATPLAPPADLPWPGARLVGADLAARDAAGRPTAAHDPAALGEVLAGLAVGGGSGAGRLG